MGKGCDEILGKLNPALKQRLVDLAGGKSDINSLKDAARKLQSQNLDQLNNIYADNNVGGYKKIEQPQEVTPSENVTQQASNGGELKIVDKTKNVLDEVTDEKIGEKKYQDFSIDFEDGARAFGTIENGVANISGINAPKNNEGVVRGTKTYERVLTKLQEKGVKTVNIKLQSEDSGKAIDKLVEKGVLSNPRNITGSSGNERATTFDISTPQAKEEKQSSQKSSPIEKEKAPIENGDGRDNPKSFAKLSDKLPEDESRTWGQFLDEGEKVFDNNGLKIYKQWDGSYQASYGGNVVLDRVGETGRGLAVKLAEQYGGAKISDKINFNFGSKETEQSIKESKNETLKTDTKDTKPIPPKESSQPKKEPIENGENKNQEKQQVTKDQPPPQKPPQPPIEGKDEQGEETGKRRFTQQMLRDEELPSESKSGIKETLDYVIQKNEVSVKEAADIINKLGTDESFNLITDKNNDLNGGVRTVMGMALIRKYGELAKKAPDQATKDYYLDKEISTAEFVTEKLATDPGQMIQAFSLWSRLSPEAQLRAANQDMAKQGKEKVRRRKKDIDKIGTEFQKANEEAAEEVSKSTSIDETVKKDDKQKESKAREKIAKAKARRASIIKKYKDKKGGGLTLSSGGLTPEGIEFIGEVTKTYIDEGIANVQLLVEKAIAAFKEATGNDPDDKIKSQISNEADNQLNKSDIKLINEALKDRNIKIGKIVKEHYTVVEKAKKSLAQKLMDEAAMEQSNAKELSDKVQAAFDRIASRKKRNILYREKGRFDKINRTLQGAKKTEQKTVADDIIKYTNLGAFDNTDFTDMLADKFGIGKITPEQAAKLQELADKIQKAPDGTPKRDATEDLLAYRAKLRGNDLGETAQAVWYANVLSGYKTQEKNLVSTFFQSMGELMSQMVADPKAIPYLMGGYIKGVSKRGFIEALHTLATGRSPIHIKKVETPQALERKKFIGGNINPANWFKYVMRVMIATDVISFQGLKEARAYQLARREASRMGLNTWSKKGWDKVNEILFHTKERWREAELQAEEEGLDGVQKRRRIYELMEESRPIQMTEDAYGFGAKGTFNHESEGSLGALTNGLSSFLEAVNVKGVKPLRFIIPFTRIITNVVNNTLDYTPVGLIRAARGVRGFKTFEKSPITKPAFKELTAEERKTLIAKAAIGITLTAALQALHLAGVIEITGAGPDDEEKKKQLRQSGWQPYSIKVGDKWYSYQYTPLVFMTGFLGNMNDTQKYGKDDEKTLGKRVQLAASRIGGQVVDMTWINSASTFMGALSERNPEQQARRLNNSLAGMVRGFVPFSGMINQSSEAVQNIFNMPQKQVNNSWQALIQNIPIARNSLNDKINALGDPIVRDTDVLISKETEDPVWNFLLDKGGWVATVNRGTLIIPDAETKEERPTTDDEYYEFSKLRGQKIKDDIQKMLDKNKVPVIRDGKSIDVTPEDVKPKELNAVLSQIETQATKETKEELFSEKVKNKKEAETKKKWNEKVNKMFDKK